MIEVLAFGCIGGVVLAAARPSWLAATFGLLLPIYGVVGVGPTVFDVARLALAAAMIVRSRTDTRPAVLYPWIIPLWTIGVLMAVDAATSPGTSSFTGGLTMLLSSTIALLLACRSRLAPQIIGGYVAGCTLSAGVLLQQAMGGVAIALPSTASYGRFAGLGSAAPRTSVELALACAFLMIRIRSASTPIRKWIFAIAATTCLAAMLTSGGRTGLAAAAVAAVIAVWQRVIRFGVAAGIAAVVWVVLDGAARFNLPLSTVTRLTQDQSGGATYDVTDGREALFNQAIGEVAKHPILGPGYGAFDARYGLMPHMSILAFAVSGGIVALLAGMFLMAKLGRIAIHRRGAGHALPALIAAILIVFALLEPDGPFVGVSFLTLMFLAVRSSEAGDDHDPARRPAVRPGVAHTVQRNAVHPVFPTPETLP